METQLTGADVAMVFVTLTIVQLVKFFLPSPPPSIPGAATKLFSVVDRWRWIPLYSAFLIAVGLSIAFDPHGGQSLMGKIRDGLQTGAYTVATWEVYNQTFQKIIDRIRGVG